MKKNKNKKYRIVIGIYDWSNCRKIKEQGILSNYQFKLFGRVNTSQQKGILIIGREVKKTMWERQKGQEKLDIEQFIESEHWLNRALKSSSSNSVLWVGLSLNQALYQSA